MENKYNFYLTNIANEDIKNSLDYIAINLSNEIAANNLLVAIENEINNICTFPFSYPDCTIFFITDKNIRRAIINNYILIYKIENSKIIVLRFLHRLQNIKSLI